jgi:hypothetical protein
LSGTCLGVGVTQKALAANILSLKRVTKKYHVAFDSKNGVLFIVTKPDGTMFKFK